MNWDNQNLIKILKDGGVVVMPTDTIYGVLGRADDESVVNRIYDIRKRAPDKPCIILIGDISELEKFSIHISPEQKEIVKKYWPASPNPDGPGPTSIVFDCTPDSLERFEYLHRWTKTLCFRLPEQASFRDLLKETGPLVAPSANPEGLTPARNIEEAKKYFGASIDLYVDGGDVKGSASKIIKLHKNGSVDILRR